MDNDANNEVNFKKINVSKVQVNLQFTEFFDMKYVA